MARVSWVWPARKVLVNMWSRMQTLLLSISTDVVRWRGLCSLRENDDYEDSFADVRHAFTVQEVSPRPVPVWRVESGVGCPLRYVRVAQQRERHILRCHFSGMVDKSLRRIT